MKHGSSIIDIIFLSTKPTIAVISRTSSLILLRASKLSFMKLGLQQQVFGRIQPLTESSGKATTSAECSSALRI